MLAIILFAENTCILCHRIRDVAWHFSQFLPHYVIKSRPKSIVCLSLPAFPVLLGLTLSPASDGLGASGTACF
jgi:hypothetical protein